ncbi:hypothetical protein CDG81_13620 [Actinopolyspora erythraea]|uniref:UDP-glucose/GDP-mannose dehydrogenase N-terminal domain-containing protein n=1 Tax=Actinopolyspora erythraea TaxID=414996 RepID=A0A223RTF1_9ACTN|nr:hypothetical protein CDG81_13620 [Actinopolyspora erythraea]
MRRRHAVGTAFARIGGRVLPSRDRPVVSDNDVSGTAPGVIGVVGAGHVGLTSAAWLSSRGHHVRCVDRDLGVVRRLSQARVDLGEPGLAELVTDGVSAGRLDFATQVSTLSRAHLVLVCVPTPEGGQGGLDTSTVEDVCARLGRCSAPEVGLCCDRPCRPVPLGVWLPS